MTCCRCNRTGRCQNCTVSRKRDRVLTVCPTASASAPNLIRSRGHLTIMIPDVPAVSRVEADHTNVCHSHHGDTSSTTGSLHPDPSPSPAADTGGFTQPRSTGIPELPVYTLPRFTWGELDSETFTQGLNHAYSTVVHWRRNIFSIPSGNAGAGFVTELSRLFHAYAVGTTQKCGTEAADYAMSMAFNNNECEAVLLVDTSNAFSSLNHQVALRNMSPLPISSKRH